MKTYTAQEFEIEFYYAISKWVSGGKIGPDPRRELECASEDTANSWVQHMVAPTFVNNNMLFRWKPAKKRTVVIDGVELVAPEVAAPVMSTVYFVEGRDGTLFSYLWNDWDGQDEALANGKVFLTREDCEAMAKAQCKQRMGGVL